MESQKILSKNNNAYGITFPDLKVYYWAILIKNILLAQFLACKPMELYYWHLLGHKWLQHLIFEKDVKKYDEEIIMKKNGVGKTEYPHEGKQNKVHIFHVL